jgi:hypothetical protein
MKWMQITSVLGRGFFLTRHYRVHIVFVTKRNHVEDAVVTSVKPWLEQAGKFPITRIKDIPHFDDPVDLAGPRTGVLHTTEGKWPGAMTVFKQHFAPHFLLGLETDNGPVRIAQLVPVGTIGASIRAHNNKAIVQIEMVGFSQKTPWQPDDKTAEALASLMAVCNKEYGIPLSHPWPDGDFGKAGDNSHRESGRFGTIAGWYGHGDCPSPDIHWDPGNLKWSVILKAAQALASGGTNLEKIDPGEMGAEV